MVYVPPTLIRLDLIQKDVEAIGPVRLALNEVGRQRAYVHCRANNSGKLQIRASHYSIEQISQQSGDRSDGQRVAHREPRSCLCKYSSTESFGRASVAGLGVGAGGWIARTSMRPMATRIIGADVEEGCSMGEQSL